MARTNPNRRAQPRTPSENSSELQCALAQSAGVKTFFFTEMLHGVHTEQQKMENNGRGRVRQNNQQTVHNNAG